MRGSISCPCYYWSACCRGGSRKKEGGGSLVRKKTVAYQCTKLKTWVSVPRSLRYHWVIQHWRWNVATYNSHMATRFQYSKATTPHFQIVSASPNDLQDYTYYFVPAPWLTVKLMRLLQCFNIPGNRELWTLHSTVWNLAKEYKLADFDLVVMTAKPLGVPASVHVHVDLEIFVLYNLCRIIIGRVLIVRF